MGPNFLNCKPKVCSYYVIRNLKTNKKTWKNTTKHKKHEKTWKKQETTRKNAKNHEKKHEKQEILSTWLARSFFDIDPFLMIFAPFESWEWGLSNGAKIIKNGSISRKIWRNQNTITNKNVPGCLTPLRRLTCKYSFLTINSLWKNVWNFDPQLLLAKRFPTTQKVCGIDAARETESIPQKKTANKKWKKEV